jgi:Bacterial toxin 30/Pretoxin HINT domain
MPRLMASARRSALMLAWASLLFAAARLTLSPSASPAQPSRSASAMRARSLVLLASGKTVPISQLKTGDTVLASDTKSGKDQPETVTAVMVHHDTDLYDLTVKTKTGTEVIHNTAGHLFWDPSLNQWLPASNLKPGEHLKTPDGTVAVADGGITPKVHDGWMWDLTVPGNNDHDFYVLPAQGGSSHHTHYVEDGDTPVLVHNCGGYDLRGKDPMSIVPDNARVRGLTPDPNGGAQYGLEFKWLNEDGVTVRLRIHGPDGTAPPGSNSFMGEPTGFRLVVGIKMKQVICSQETSITRTVHTMIQVPQMRRIFHGQASFRDSR